MGLGWEVVNYEVEPWSYSYGSGICLPVSVVESNCELVHCLIVRGTEEQPRTTGRYRPRQESRLGYEL